ncbi:MAG: 16S rRNA (uracil1498-N3)-methyltransferase [Parcubacteria group bacterium Gr01-1014_18]|nr:MAG: 16S rRNA (uracil1498-N3)-methyltransferase [Parcubacteria group bacterium Greene0416_36]TSC80871.1 MAG: 16S rRNA (uracil1498-N3)-methyltransferase [Parcubacteria group bacterium Gr01-1014_18]TSC99532.1 MAG: 16S rRNA (uracil1498-N3)-methyltransferase [Parcubacteria group bacterium Greene1014_20]TSD07549.1 MAG: 16S rRNA (uracil1498-N3)-methyltransferase [Parcubacteria group bacterium Greene0714_2]
MKLHRFYIDHPLDQEFFEIIDEEILHQAKDVFRFASGDNFVLWNGRGREILAVLDDYTKGALSVHSVQSIENKNELPVRLVLYCAVLKADHFEWVVEKTTEIGVSLIVPILSERTVKMNLRADRLAKIAKEAAEQSCRAKVPGIAVPISLDKAIAEFGEGMNYVFHSGPNLQSIQLNKKSDQGSVGLWIGPEGGWSEAEIKKFEYLGSSRKDFSFASLGKTILRAETAAICACFSIAQKYN